MVKRTTRKSTKRRTAKPGDKFRVTAVINLRSNPISKTAAEKLKKDVLKRTPNAKVTIRKV